MSDRQPRLDFDSEDPLEARDGAARRLAVDPSRNVALEASAGTGKTRVLVDRYIALLLAGVKPRHILAITFTRKAAAEMRRRILQELAQRHRELRVPPAPWREIRENLTDVSISTIDAFCLALLHEFPLEADVDPGFDLADETETPRLVDEALERALRIGRGIAIDQPEMALLFAELGEFRLRQGLARLIDRRLVAWDALGRFLRRAHGDTIEEAVAALLGRLRSAFDSVPGGSGGLADSGPDQPSFRLMLSDLRRLLGEPPPTPAQTQALLERVREHLLTQDGEPRKRLTYKKADFRSSRDYERHAQSVTALGPYLVDALRTYRQDINLVLTRAVRQLFAIALEQYEATLRKYGVLDFSGVLERTLRLLSQMDEFSRSRFKLEARYQHVLVDEFQDTSRAQWALVELLVRSWAAGLGLTEGGLQPSIFIVGDRKQSIYGFRDAEVALLDEAARYIDALRPIGQVRTAITRSFRSVRELLSFVNDLFAAVDKVPTRTDAFRYSEDDIFPVDAVEAREPEALGMVAASSDEQQAEAVADEIAHLLATGASVRDRETGVRRAVRPGDIAVLFRTREGHRVFEEALARRRVPFYVYKGLGFFDADEIKDTLALLAFLARPESELNAAAFLRSRFIRVSDAALKRLAPALAAALVHPLPPATLDDLDAPDRERLVLARAAVPSWLALVDRLPPSELVDRVLVESAYAAEIGGPGFPQARENLKKVRGLIRRIQNRGYATLARVVDHFIELAAGSDESNAMVDALDAVNLMTTHAAKGLEFPVVFVVNLHRGSGGSSDPIRIAVPAPGGEGDQEPSVAIGEYESDGDADLEARELEETKRLLYVAVTRARDRLYLATSLTADGRFMTAKGSLGRTIPASLAAVLTETASTTESTAAWQGTSAEHRFRVLRPSPEPRRLPLPATPHRIDDFVALPMSGRRRIAATAVLVGSDSSSAERLPFDVESQSSASTAPRELIGSLVHRAVAAGYGSGAFAEVSDAAIDALVRDHERATIDDPSSAFTAVRSALLRLAQDPRLTPVAAGVESGIVWRRHEVPFSLCRNGDVVRGVMDCVIQRTDGAVEVLEFKTGQPVAEHSTQLELYLEAARQLFGPSKVTGEVIYTG